MSEEVWVLVETHDGEVNGLQVFEEKEQVEEKKEERSQFGTPIGNLSIFGREVVRDE